MIEMKKADGINSEHNRQACLHPDVLDYGIIEKSTGNVDML